MNQDFLNTLAQAIKAQRKRQGLSREQAALVCNVSVSFIRDAESQPQRCQLGKLVQLLEGLGMGLAIDTTRVARSNHQIRVLSIVESVLDERRHRSQEQNP